MRKIFILFALCTSVAVMATEGALSGRFTINENGDQVVFSQGNLQYVGAWQFAEHQWDYFGENQSDNHRDLFGWGTGDAPNKVSEDDNDYSTFVDWGTNAVTNGGNTANQWRTLTTDEWGYLFDTRAEAGSKYGASKVNEIPGIVFLPDNWTLPNGCCFTPGMTNASSWVDWSYVASTNVYDATQWTDMESAGAVFLPAVGNRWGADVTGVCSFGSCWSATPYGTDKAYGFNFWSSDLAAQQTYSKRFAGFSVRLVQDAKDEPSTHATVNNADVRMVTRKVVREGQVLIEREGKTYNVQGQEMK